MKTVEWDRGIKETTVYEDDRTVIHREQDVQPIIEHCHAMSDFVTKPVDGLGYYAGTVPEAVIEAYMYRRGITFEEFMQNEEHVRRLLNDPDFKKFRVWKGKV